MGVIHKLREDIVSFIITLKRNNSSIGVRQLAVLTSEQFHTEVSKSSVNSVLKKAALSSSVGRRPGGGIQSEKFSIPTVKKDQISKSMRAAGFLKENKKKVPPAPEEEIRSLPQKQSQDEDSVSVTEALGDQDFSAYVNTARNEKRLQGTPISDGAGFVFLKAAQWEISRHSLMAELFKKHIKFSVSNHFDFVSDMFSFFKFLGAETIDHVSAYRGHGLWVLNNFCDSPTNEKKDLLELQKLFQWDETMRESSSLSNLTMEYNRIKEQAFLEVAGFRLLLEDKSELTMDASMGSFWGGDTMPSPSGSSLPIHKAMERLSNRLVSNIQSAIFHRAPGETRFDRAVYDMVAVFENISGKRILKTSVLDAQGGEIAEFLTVPFHKRTFLFGIGPQQKEFGELTKAVKWAGKRPFYHSGTDKTGYFAETKTNFMTKQVNESIGDLRVITVWNDKGSDPCWGILTNQQNGSAEDILQTYMFQWPYLGESLQEDPVVMLSPGDHDQDQTTGKEAGKKDCSIFNDFVGALHGYCQKHFFPPGYTEIGVSHLITSIYGVPGVYYEKEDALSVFLDVEKGSAYHKDLEDAVKRVNDRHILDYSGRRLWLEI